MDCPKCGAHNETDVGSCLSCGAHMPGEDMVEPTLMKPPSRTPAQKLQQSGGAPRQCPNCMTLNAASFKFCARCGTPLTPSAAAPPPKVAGWPVARRDAKPAAPGARAPTQPSAPPGPLPPTGKTHAAFKFEGEQLTIQDSGTQNGVFLWFKERQIQSGDELRIGRQRLRIEWLPEEPETAADQPLWGSPDPGYVARAVQLLEGGGEGDVFPLKQGENLVGRGSGDVSFPQDGYVSSRHCLVTVGDDGQIGVKDLGSANGTFVKINGSS